MFVQGQVYRRRDLHQLYGGQRQGGISTPSDRDFIMLFTGEQGHQYGYRDDWNDEGAFLYTGEGQAGDMAFIRGNRAIRDHAVNGKDLHLFKYVRRGQVRYISQMVCAGFQERKGLDREGKERLVIVFELVPISAFGDSMVKDETQAKDLWARPLSTLRERAFAASHVEREQSERRQWVYYRSHAVRTYVLKRADGRCEACDSEAPFKTSEGRPYLEPHHLRRLSDGGPDHPRWVAALCPNCHRRAHYGADRSEFNSRLVEIVEVIEASDP